MQRKIILTLVPLACFSLYSKVAVDLVPRVVVSLALAEEVDSVAACSANVSVVELVLLAQVVPTMPVVETPAHSTQLPKLSSMRTQCSTDVSDVVRQSTSHVNPICMYDGDVLLVLSCGPHLLRLARS